MSQDARIRELVRLAQAGDADAEAALRRVLERADAEPWRATPAAFAEHVSGGRWQRARHLDYLSDKLAEAAYERDKRITVSMPVRHGKSWLTSMWFVVWYLDRWPARKIILVGHSADFARKWGRRVRNLIRKHAKLLRVRLAPDMTAADAWETTEGGGMITAGVEGNINGEGCDLMVVDDYLKNATDANSRARRDKLVDFWESTAETRMEPGASCVIVATRWHEEDLIGHLVSQEQDDEDEGEEANRDRWERVTFPAIAEENDVLGRQPGEALWPERWPLWRLERKRRAKGPWIWAALYQQRPSPAGGGIFKRAWLRFYGHDGASLSLNSLIRYRDPSTGDVRAIRVRSLSRFSTTDLAVSQKTQADYMVVSTWGLAPDGALFLLHVFRGKVEGPDLVPTIEAQLDRWEAACAWIESQGFQLGVVQTARRRGLPVRELHADKDKIARAMEATAEMEAGAVFFDDRADWWPAFEEELLRFPQGHDDQVDTLAYAVRIAIEFGRGAIDPEAASQADDDPDDDWEDERDDDDLRTDGALF